MISQFGMSNVALLEHNRRQLLELAARLLEKEVLEGAELRSALAGAEATTALENGKDQMWSSSAIRH